MLLITSGAYVESELAAEFGRIPPAFLPVGNRRLYTYQIRQFGALHERVVMTLPDDFVLDEADALCLREHGVTLFRTPPEASLGAAVHAFLRETGAGGQLDILYGDTLITDPVPDRTTEAGRADSDWLAVGQTDEYYNWHHEVPADGRPGGAWTGLFSFARAALLRDLLAAGGDFIGAVQAYDRHVGGMAHWNVARWLDFGHVHTYFDSKRIITTQRHFNQLRVVDGVVTKSGRDSAKIMAEAAWFEGAPALVKPFLAPYICRVETVATTGGGDGAGDGAADRAEGGVGYQLEYLHLAALNELYVFGRLPERVWKRIFHACDAYLRAASSLPATPLDDKQARHIYVDKTLQRLDTYAGQAGIDLDAPWTLNARTAPPLNVIAHDAAAALLENRGVPSFLHGDFCFSNILFDFRARRVKMIDPRGIDALGRPSRFGDLRYDLGKLAHSVLGLYDFIMAGCYLLRREGQALTFRVLSERCLPLQRLFAATPFAGRLPAQWQCHPAMVLLFLSMLPLHADDPRRQQALMANGIRLYLEWRSDDRHPHGGTEPAFS
jgi:hypothetical protein